MTCTRCNDGQPIKDLDAYCDQLGKEEQAIRDNALQKLREALAHGEAHACYLVPLPFGGWGPWHVAVRQALEPYSGKSK